MFSVGPGCFPVGPPVAAWASPDPALRGDRWLAWRRRRPGDLDEAQCGPGHELFTPRWTVCNLENDRLMQLERGAHPTGIEAVQRQVCAARGPAVARASLRGPGGGGFRWLQIGSVISFSRELQSRESGADPARSDTEAGSPNPSIAGHPFGPRSVRQPGPRVLPSLTSRGRGLGSRTADRAHRGGGGPSRPVAAPSAPGGAIPDVCASRSLANGATPRPS